MSRPERVGAWVRQIRGRAPRGNGKNSMEARYRFIERYVEHPDEASLAISNAQAEREIFLGLDSYKRRVTRGYGGLANDIVVLVKRYTPSCCWEHKRLPRFSSTELRDMCRAFQKVAGTPGRRVMTKAAPEFDRRLLLCHAFLMIIDGHYRRQWGAYRYCFQLQQDPSIRDGEPPLAP